MIRALSLAAALLVATPALGDPNFDRTVVLMLEHTEDGAVGLVLNRPSGTDLDEAGADWEGWDLLAAQPPVVFVGGPVSRTAVPLRPATLGVATAEAAAKASRHSPSPVTRWSSLRL